MNKIQVVLLAGLLGLLVTGAKCAPTDEHPGAGTTNAPAATNVLAATNASVRLTLELKDGNRIIGQPVAATWPVQTELTGKLDADLSKVTSLEATKTGGWTVSFRNGDRLRGTVTLAALELNTSFGAVKIAPELVRSIQVAGAAGVRHALKFNLNNRVEIPNDPALQFGPGPFAISFWVKTGSDRSLMSFISKRTTPAGDGWVVHQDHGQLLFYCAGCAAPKSGPVSLRDGQWHQVVVTRSADRMLFYLDGESVGSGETRCDHLDSNPLCFGMDGKGDAGSWNLEGELSEVHIYGRTLSQGEVAEEWNNGAGLTQAVAGGGLIAGYHFDEGQGNVTKDFTGNHHDGTLVNGPEWEQ